MLDEYALFLLNQDCDLADERAQAEEDARRFPWPQPTAEEAARVRKMFDAAHARGAAMDRAAHAYVYAIDPYGLVLDMQADPARHVIGGKEVPLVHRLLEEIDAVTHEIHRLPPKHPDRSDWVSRLDGLTMKLIAERRR